MIRLLLLNNKIFDKAKTMKEAFKKTKTNVWKTSQNNIRITITENGKILWDHGNNKSNNEKLNPKQISNYLEKPANKF